MARYSIKLTFTRDDFKGVKQIIGIVWISCDRDGNFNLEDELDTGNDGDFEDIIKHMAIYGDVVVEQGEITREEE